jgi:chromosome segregation ATPase
VDSVDQEKLKQEIKQLKQDIKAKTASVSLKKLEKKKLDKAICDTEKEIKEMSESTTREKEAVQELKEQVEQLEAADKEMDEMIASLDKLGTVYELKRQDKQQAIDDLLNTLSELNYDISELKGEP